ncbi:hypothetical protein [Janthinobacterium sp. LB3P112]|uniref:hypothetical protein n=1 Tax=Janthinobacterium sp. LB3P112 TaxID=3424196 RepID=UPI003F2476B2
MQIRRSGLHAEIDQRIAFYLMRFGNSPQRAEAVVLDEKLHGVVFSRTPDELFKGQPFGLIGELGGMISWAFAEHTIQDGQVIALDSYYGKVGHYPGSIAKKYRLL